MNIVESNDKYQIILIMIFFKKYIYGGLILLLILILINFYKFQEFDFIIYINQIYGIFKRSYGI